MIERGEKTTAIEKESASAERIDRIGELTEKTAALYRSVKDAIGKAYDKLVSSGAEKKQQEALAARLQEVFRSGVRNLEYKAGDGIVGGVAKRNPETGGKTAIRADGFVDCCALILRTPDAVGINHISPLTLDEFEGRPDHVAEDLKTKDRLGSIRTTLAEMVVPPKERELHPGTTLPQVYEVIRPGSRTDLALEELRVMAENLNVSIISGNPDLARAIAGDFQEGGALGLNMKVQTVELGTGDKKVIATPEEIFVICDDKRIVEVAGHLTPTAPEP